MKAHIDHAGVQEQGCTALVSVAFDNDDNEVLIANAGGIAVIVSGMKAHIDHAGVQEQGCMALVSVAFDNDDNQVLIANAGDIAVIVSGMSESPYRPRGYPRGGMRCTHQSCYQ